MIFILSFYYVIDKNLFSLFKEKGNFVCARHPFDDRYLKGALGAHWADYYNGRTFRKSNLQRSLRAFKAVCDKTGQIYDWWKCFRKCNYLMIRSVHPLDGCSVARSVDWSVGLSVRVIFSKRLDVTLPCSRLYSNLLKRHNILLVLLLTNSQIRLSLNIVLS